MTAHWKTIYFTSKPGCCAKLRLESAVIYGNPRGVEYELREWSSFKVKSYNFANWNIPNLMCISNTSHLWCFAGPCDTGSDNSLGIFSCSGCDIISNSICSFLI